MIRSIEVIPLHLPVAQTLTLSRGVATDPSAGAPHILAQITDNNGLVGWGEARPSHRWSYETEETVITTIRKYLAPALLAQDESDLARFGQAGTGHNLSADGQWVAIADDPLVFMTNNKFLKENNLQPPASWNDLLHPAYKNMLQMADARTSGTAVTRIVSILEVNGRDEIKAFAYMKQLRPNVQLYTKSGGGGTLPVGLGQAGGGIFFIVDALDTKAKGYDVSVSFPKEGIGTAAEAIALLKGAKNPEAGKKLIDWASSPAMHGPPMAARSTASAA